MEITDTEFKFTVAKLIRYIMGKLNLKNPPAHLYFINDKNNANNLLGKTGYYNPHNKSIYIFTTDRHPKDMLRSIAHEMIHFFQDTNGMLDTTGYAGKGYAQKNMNLRKSEKQAYLLGNLLLRDWEDEIKEKQN